jgi:YesN/AraC family two-component response regulator
MLAELNFQVIEADSANEAMMACEHQHPDIILTDVYMPGYYEILTIVACRSDRSGVTMGS